MAFFYLKPDTNVPYQVTAFGHTAYQSIISVASNATHLVEVNLCKTVDLQLQVINESTAQGLVHATLNASVDGREPLQLQTSDKGHVHLNIDTGLKVLTIQPIDFPVPSKDVTFEFQDNLDFLKEANVHISILENLVKHYKTPYISASSTAMSLVVIVIVNPRMA